MRAPAIDADVQTPPMLQTAPGHFTGTAMRVGEQTQESKSTTTQNNLVIAWNRSHRINRLLAVRLELPVLLDNSEISEISEIAEIAEIAEISVLSVLAVLSEISDLSDRSDISDISDISMLSLVLLLQVHDSNGDRTQLDDQSRRCSYPRRPPRSMERGI